MDLNYRTFVVANPVAGAGAVEEEWDLIERLLRARIPEFDAAFTEGPGHATLLTREALRSGWEMVVCIGGDGTLNEVVNGFYKKPNPADAFELADGWVKRTGKPKVEPINPGAVLGHVPVGTGGDFRRTIGFMGGIGETIEHLSGRDVRPVDLGRLTYLDADNQLTARYFLNIASAGFSGTVDSYVNSTWKGWGGKTSFFVGSARAFATWRNPEVEVLLDDTTGFREDLMNLVVANGEYFGGGMWVAPGAELDDGVFQVVVMGNIGKLQSVNVMRLIYKGKHLREKNIRRHRAEQVSARATEPDAEILLDVDGEVPGKLPATWTIHPQSLHLKV